MESRSHWLRATSSYLPSWLVDQAAAQASVRGPDHRLPLRLADSQVPGAQCDQGGQQQVPDVAVYVAAKRLDVPSHAEGFDCLYRVRVVGQSDYEITVPPS